MSRLIANACSTLSAPYSVRRKTCNEPFEAFYSSNLISTHLGQFNTCHLLTLINSKSKMNQKEKKEQKINPVKHNSKSQFGEFLVSA